MFATADDRTMTTSRLIGVALTLFISLALPIGIICLSVRFAFSEWPFGAECKEFHAYSSGRIRNGELWYPVE